MSIKSVSINSVHFNNIAFFQRNAFDIIGSAPKAYEKLSKRPLYTAGMCVPLCAQWAQVWLHVCFCSSRVCSSLKAIDSSGSGGAPPRSGSRRCTPQTRSAKWTRNPLGLREAHTTRLSSGAGIGGGGETGARRSPRAPIDAAGERFSNARRSSPHSSAQEADRTRVGRDGFFSGSHISFRCFEAVARNVSKHIINAHN